MDDPYKNAQRTDLCRDSNELRAMQCHLDRNKGGNISRAFRGMTVIDRQKRRGQIASVSHR